MLFRPPTKLGEAQGDHDFTKMVTRMLVLEVQVQVQEQEEWLKR